MPSTRTLRARRPPLRLFPVSVIALVHRAPLLALAVAAAALWYGVGLAQTPPPGSIALRWNDCYSDGGTAARTFACDTNSGTETLVVSAYSPADLPELNGATSLIHVWSTAANTPDWWSISSTGCRGSVAMAVAVSPPPTSTTCIDPWQGQAVAGGVFEPNYFNVNISRMRTVCGIPGSTAVPANTEIYLSTILIRHTKTVGAGSCAGCGVGTCIGLESVQLTQPVGVGDYTLIQPLPNSTSDVAGWQMDASMPESIFPYHGTAVWEKDFLSCSAAVTAARRPTWGAVKSLYR